MKLAANIFILWVAAHTTLAQDRGTIRGTVADAATGMPLAGASVTIQTLPYGASTDEHGEFTIGGLNAARYRVSAGMLGYAQVSQEVVLERGGEAVLSFKLEESTISLKGVMAVADRPYSAASSRALRTFDLLIRPSQSAQDLLRVVPGLVIAQHAGGGKAEQIFLRGFDADHGTDVALSVDGMPVNMVSHGHGQGYADLHFLIPETVAEMDVRKGPYFADAGNLATAGSVQFRTRDHLDHNMIRLQGGAFGTGAVTALYQIPTAGSHRGAYLAGQLFRSDGPFNSPQDFRRANLYGKFHTHLPNNASLALSVSGFSSAWDASGQVPARAVSSGTIDRFGAIDDREGGVTGRQDFNLVYESRSEGESNLRLQSYVSRYHFKLFSNFTFFLEDPELGDMIEQVDDRTLMGFNGAYRKAHGLPVGTAITTLGGGFRADDTEVSLWKSPDRIRSAALVDAEVAERNLYLWAEEELIFSPKLRLQLGLRADYFTFDVEDRLERDELTLPHASGYAQQGIISPKANLVVSPTRYADFFVNAGTGFHSNDARDVVLGARVADLARRLRRTGLDEASVAAEIEARQLDPAQEAGETLPRATGGEVGIRIRPLESVVLSAATWVLDLEREFVFVGDGGFTELSGATRRYGLDLEGRVELRSWLWLDADVTLSEGRFRNEPKGADAIPLAPTLTTTGGLTVRHPSGWEGSVRMRHVGDRPANEDATVTAEGYTIVDALATRHFGDFSVSAMIENLLNVAWNEAQFATESRLRGEAVSVNELHYTPGMPRSVRLGISYRF